MHSGKSKLLGFRAHAALYLTQGDNRRPALYDPSGSYARHIDPNSGGMLTGNDAAPNKFSEFYKWFDGDKTESTCQLANEEEEINFYKKALELERALGQCVHPSYRT
jgi:hypothetical protein